MLKKILALVLVICLLISNLPVVFATEHECYDDDDDHYCDVCDDIVSECVDENLAHLRETRNRFMISSASAWMKTVTDIATSVMIS